MAEITSLPSWLSPNTDYAGSFEHGLTTGENVRASRERSGMAKEALALEGQRLAASEREAASRAQIQRESIMANFQRAQTQAAVTKAYHDAQLGLAKGRLTIEAAKIDQAEKEKAAIISDRQGYAMAVASGMKPAQALAQYPRAWSPGLAASGTKQPEETVTRRTNIPEVLAKDPVPASPGWKHGYLLGFGKGWGAHPAVAGNPYVPKQTLSESVKVPPGTSAAAAFQDQQPGAAAPAGPAGPGPAPAAASAPALPKAGDVVNGYSFKGGDPSDQKNWEPVNAQ